MPLSSLSHQFRPRIAFGLSTPPRPTLRTILPKPEAGDSMGMDSPTPLASDPILAQSPNRPTKFSFEDNIGGFPVRSLVVIVSSGVAMETREVSRAGCRISRSVVLD